MFDGQLGRLHTFEIDDRILPRMPIFHVDVYGSVPETLARGLAEPLGTLMGSPPGHTWVRTTACPPSHYAENGTPEQASPERRAPEEQPPAWVFVRVILRALPEEDALAERAMAITKIVAEQTGRSVEDVHVLFEPPAAGRIAFGGELVRSR